MPDLSKASLMEHYMTCNLHAIIDVQLSNHPFIHYSSASNPASLRLEARGGSIMSNTTSDLALAVADLQMWHLPPVGCANHQPSPTILSQLDDHLAITVNSSLHTRYSVVISQDAAQSGPFAEHDRERVVCLVTMTLENTLAQARQWPVIGGEDREIDRADIDRKSGAQEQRYQVQE